MEGSSHTIAASTPVQPSHGINETSTEYYNDVTLAIAFFLTTLVAFKRMHWSWSQGGVETTVVTAFYSLILITSLSRTLWFTIPSYVLEPTYAPVPIMAFGKAPWVGTFLSEVLLSFGSLCLFSIFILILVYWHDILLKYFYPGLKRNKPISTFLTITGFLFVLQGTNMALFLLKFYTSEGMILVDSVLLGAVSLICVAEISIFSHRFRTVLRTLGAINQVSTESQVKRIVWITVTGNIYFLVRAALEISLSISLILHYNSHKTFLSAFTDRQWDLYILAKHWCEVAILCLMLYILQSRFTTNNKDKRGAYQKVPDAAAVTPSQDIKV
mmetsp:Transcript_16373/g.33702  ORF Transcript_16373/g.33702 Transcript_16373/m.33702 type:complete len:328 (-) Transcript_16373:57-1040(-)